MAPSGKWIEGIGPDTTVADAALRSLEQRLAVTAHALPLAAYLAEHDIEYVHRLRVATRRAHAALKLYRDVLPQKQARWFKRQLRKMRRTAGDARDLDVLIARLKHESQPQAEPLVRFLAQKRVAVQPDILKLAEDVRRDDRFIRKAAKMFGKMAASSIADESESAARLCDWAPQQLAKFRDAVIELLPDESDDIDALHQFRIRVKALRYAIELLAPAFEPQLRSEVYPTVEKLQERLGTITDHIAAIRLFGEWDAHSSTPASPTSISCVEVEKSAQFEDLQDFHNWWTPERASWLEQSLASHTDALSGENQPNFS